MILTLLMPGACSVPKEINPVWIYDQVSGRADRGRPVLPGLDRPFPNLASVPPRPERPPLATREDLSNSLAGYRSASRTPLEPRQDAAPPSFADAPGTPALPGAPPPPPTLAAAPAIPWDTPGMPAASPATPAAVPGSAAPAGTRATPTAPAVAVPTAPPPAPPPDLLGPPALPPADMLAPAPAQR